MAVVVLLMAGPASATTIPTGNSQALPSAPSGAGVDLQLEVFVNGVTSGFVGAFRQEADGTMSVAPSELTDVGIRPQPAAMQDGRIILERLSGISFSYDTFAQTLQFQTTDPYRVPRTVNARGEVPQEREEEEAPQSDVGLVTNYTLFSNFQNEQWFTLPDFQGVSATLESVLFSPYGNISNSMIASSQSNFGTPEFIRLNTSWSYLDPKSMTAYTVGDLISGGLLWTRPVRMGGIQMRRNFSLRPDFITMPIPSLSGSAAVPSTVEVYMNGMRTMQGDLPGGPFQVTSLPVVAGPGTARLVIRDASGQEIVTDAPFYASSQLLATGLLDFSLEAGYARNFFGIYSDSYDNTLMGSATARYGLTDRVTLEGHAEGGGDLLNGGFGAAFNVGTFGVASAAVAASYYDNQTGFQVAGSLEVALGDWRLFLRSQRTFGAYNDIAGVTADIEGLPPPFFGSTIFNADPPRALDQISLSLPPFEKSVLSFNFANYDQGDGNNYQVAGVSYSRPLFGGTLYANGFADVTDTSNFGATIGFSMPLGSQSSGSIGVNSDSTGTRFVTEASRAEGTEPGSYGWRFLDAEGSNPYRAAGASYRGQYGRAEVGVQQYDSGAGVTATVQGAVVMAGGGIFLSNQIDDSFSVVDVGVPDVPVMVENRPAGRTGATGKLLVPGLQSYQKNSIQIDPTNMPLDADLPETSRQVVPASRSGVVVKFDARSEGASAMVTFVDLQGKPLPLGTVVTMDGAAATEMVGYDGHTFLKHLAARNGATLNLPDGNSCRAEFDYTPQPGQQVHLRDVRCQ